MKSVSIQHLRGIKLSDNRLSSFLADCDQVDVVNNIKIHGNHINSNSIVMVPSEECPLFYMVQKIIIKNTNMIIVAQFLPDVYLDIELNAFEMITDRFQWKILDKNELNSCVVTHKVQIHNGCQYLVRNWF